MYYHKQLSGELDARNKLDETPFSVAAREGRINILKMYYDEYPNNQFNPDARSLDGWTAFNYACINGFLNTIEFLAEKRVNIHTSDRINRTALHWACRFNNTKVVQILLKLNLNLESTDKESQKPMDLAKIHDAIDVLALVSIYKDDEKQKNRPGSARPTDKNSKAGSGANTASKAQPKEAAK